MEFSMDYKSPTKETMVFEKWYFGLSDTERQIVDIREEYRQGKIDGEQYEEIIEQILFYSKEDGDEKDRLWEKYVGKEGE